MSILFAPLSVFVLLLLAPYSTWCHDLIMNPFVRKLGSFWLIPLLLTVFPFVRRHLLRRYLAEIGREFAEWQERYIYPTDDFLPTAFIERLHTQRRVLLIGQSGLGKTSYFKHLTAFHAGDNKSIQNRKNVVPVFIPLSTYPGGPPEEFLYDQLSNFGRMTDAELNKWFLERGGFVILLDGLNEVTDEAKRMQLSNFVNRHWKANLFSISSQHAYAEFSALSVVPLEPLNRHKINIMIRSLLPEISAERFIDHLTDEMYRVYGIPRDLEFAIEIFRRCDAGSLPKSRNELYAAALSPVIESWLSSGHADFRHRLFSRAYEMLREREPFFDSQKTPLPDEIVNALYDQRFLVKSGSRFHFRHDLVRDFLAAQHFFPRWNTLLAANDSNIDDNWAEMLKFAISALVVNCGDDIKPLMEVVLTRSPNKRFVGLLFNWLQETYQANCEPWEREFKEKFGEAMLDTLTD